MAGIRGHDEKKKDDDQRAGFSSAMMVGNIFVGRKGLWRTREILESLWTERGREGGKRDPKSKGEREGPENAKEEGGPQRNYGKMREEERWWQDFGGVGGGAVQCSQASGERCTK